MRPQFGSAQIAALAVVAQFHRQVCLTLCVPEFRVLHLEPARDDPFHQQPLQQYLHQTELVTFLASETSNQDNR